MKNKNLIYTSALFLVLIFGLANSGQHPVSSNSGYTGAPGDSNCSHCHSGTNNSIEGSINITGLPDTIVTNNIYKLTVIITSTNNNAKKAGFQLVALTGTNTNAGSLSNNAQGTEIRTVFGGKTYLGHAPSANIAANTNVTYTVDWTAPATPGLNPVIKFYAMGLLANDNNETSGDRVVATSKQIPIKSLITPLTVNIFDVTPAKCIDSLNGAARAVASGGSGVYTYLWSNGITTAENTVMLPGSNSVTVSDNAGATVTANVTIPSPPEISISFNSTSACDSLSKGNVTAIPTGGVGNFSFLWSNNATSNTLSDVTPALYKITVTDQNNCKKASEVSIAINTPIKLNSTVTKPTCTGDNNGSIIVSASGGKPEYSYKWSNGNTTSKTQNLSPGLYTITVTDVIGCTMIDSFTVSAPDTLASIIEIKKDPVCFGEQNGQIKIKANGGSPDYQFVWSDGTIGAGTSSTISNLKSGMYSVTITDLLDCKVVSEIELKNPNQLMVSKTIENAKCFGTSDGGANISVIGTSNPIIYHWSNSDTVANIKNLKAGKYFVTATDAIKKCSVVDSIIVIQPDSLKVRIDSIYNNVCFGDKNGKIMISPSGGTAHYRYNWSNLDTTATIKNLKSGEYKYTVTDANNCSLSGKISVKEPLPLKINVDSINKSTCKEVGDGFLSVKIQNNQGPYQMKWSNCATTPSQGNLTTGQYYIQVTDSLKCTGVDTFNVGTNPGFKLPSASLKHINCFGDSTGQISVLMDTLLKYQWSTGDTSHIITKLPAGRYLLTGTDKKGCKSGTDTLILTQPPIIKSELLASDNLICPGSKGGTLSLKVSGGFDTLYYRWNTGDSLSNIKNLSPGFYTVSITDKNLCKLIKTYKINTTDTLRIIGKNVKDILCVNANIGEIEVKTSGGFGALKYTWSGSDSINSKISGLAQGLYSVTITDQKNCFITDTFRVNKVDVLSVTRKITDETIAGKSDGKVELTIMGGTPPFVVVWSNGRTGATVENMPPGLYNYFVEDKNKCRSTGFAVIGGGICLLTASIKTLKPATCQNSFDGAIELDISGSFTKCKIEVFSSGGLYKFPLDSLKPDKYTLLISDSSDCSALLTNIVVPSKNPPMELDKIFKFGPGTASLKNGRMEALIKGGTPPLTFSWFKDEKKVGDSSLVEGLNVGIYQLVVTDAAGCEFKVSNIVLSVLSDTDELLSSSITLYPNPANKLIFLGTNSNLLIEKIQIINNTGQIISELVPTQFQDNYPIDLTSPVHLNPGMYYLRVLSYGKVITKKFIVLE